MGAEPAKGDWMMVLPMTLQGVANSHRQGSGMATSFLYDAAVGALHACRAGDPLTWGNRHLEIDAPTSVILTKGTDELADLLMEYMRKNDMPRVYLYEPALQALQRCKECDPKSWE